MDPKRDCNFEDLSHEPLSKLLALDGPYNTFLCDPLYNPILRSLDYSSDGSKTLNEPDGLPSGCWHPLGLGFVVKGFGFGGSLFDS